MAFAIFPLSVNCMSALGSYLSKCCQSDWQYPGRYKFGKHHPKKTDRCNKVIGIKFQIIKSIFSKEHHHFWSKKMWNIRWMWSLLIRKEDCIISPGKLEVFTYNHSGIWKLLVWFLVFNSISWYKIWRHQSMWFHSTDDYNKFSYFNQISFWDDNSDILIWCLTRLFAVSIGVFVVVSCLDYQVVFVKL